MSSMKKCLFRSSGHFQLACLFYCCWVVWAVYFGNLNLVGHIICKYCLPWTVFLFCLRPMLFVLVVVHDFIGVYIFQKLSNISFKYLDFIVCQLNLDRTIKLYFFIQRFFLWQILYVSGYIYICVCVCVCVYGEIEIHVLNYFHFCAY